MFFPLIVSKRVLGMFSEGFLGQGREHFVFAGAGGECIETLTKATPGRFSKISVHFRFRV